MPTLLDYGAQTQQEQLSHYLRRPVRDLAEELAAETLKFQAHQPYSDAPGMALFTLAIVCSNQEAWAVLYEQYKPLVLAWATQNPLIAPVIARNDDPASLVNGVFTKFFLGVTPEKFQCFSSLATLLKYLHCCTQSVVYDEVRRYQAHSAEVPLDEVKHEPVQADFTENIEVSIRAQCLWQVVMDELRSDEERQLIHQFYLLGMKPREICRRNPTTYPTVDSVHNVRRRVVERLRRSARFRKAVLSL